MSSLRFKVVEAAFQKKPLEIKIPKERPSEYFAKYVFNQEKMFKYLPKSTYKNSAKLSKTALHWKRALPTKWQLA